MFPHARHTPKQTTDSQGSKPRWFVARPSPLAAAFTGIVIVVMLGLGAFIISEYRALQLQAHGKVGGVYIDSLLAPYVQSHVDGGAEMSPQLEQVMRNLTRENSGVLLRVWRLDGRLLFSSQVGDTVERHDSKDLDKALAGNFVAKLETSGVVDASFPIRYPFFEVYAPIHDPNTGTIIAIGEIYRDASEILLDRTFVERAVWASITLVTLSVLAMLALSFSQSAQLEDRLEAMKQVTAQNRRLRRDADQARLDAAQANEQVLNQVGAELHDGPVQLLGLMSLMGATDARSRLADGTTLGSLIDRVMTELRTMSAGLILPELAGQDARAVVELAVERHHALTGGEVNLNLDQLPDVALDFPRRICLYRVVQEGLMNAAHHGGGSVPYVRIRSTDAALEILVRNHPSKQTEAPPQMPTWRLGLHGMRRRLEAFGGTLVLDNIKDETSLLVTLPLNMSSGRDPDNFSRVTSV